MYYAYIIVKQPDQCVSGFVIGRQLFLRFTHQVTAAFRSHHNPLRGFIHGLHVYHRHIAAGCQQRSLIDQVCKIRPGETGCLLGNGSHIHIRSHGLAFGVDVQNRFPSPHIRTVYYDLTVKTAGT